MDTLNLGVGTNSYYKEMVRDLFPNATLTPIKSVRKFLKGQYKEVDALVYSAEAGAAWAMLYPAYSSVIPSGLMLKVPVGFALPKSQGNYVQFINTWLKLTRSNGKQQIIYNYWILGKNPKQNKRRWSVMNNVWGWDI